MPATDPVSLSVCVRGQPLPAIEPTWARRNDFEGTLPKDVERALGKKA